MVKKIKIFKSFLLIIIILVSCVSNETKFQITISSLQEADKPYPIIILTNKRKNDEPKFPEHYYQIHQRDLKKIEKKCSVKRKLGEQKLLLIEINKNNKKEKYFFNKKESIDILKDIQKFTSGYDNESLTEDLLYLQKVTENLSSLSSSNNE
ncbi:hypothetical protein IQ37_12615 [Chryseobacterium piperi]|uniref:Lipoprotein n=1 Tax=Chryseobacterium piperi TaxID=558152 RepID=A0A086B8I0_9FLAO|nr:hypothetical protein [Chryseobacterium piperi]ASW74901.1 hypothetical protein CJF12_11825 [Chryseobacterium piperi]KFF25244.1 hypothetical protein IQ37_12615 [Chryseobacterium piperi]